MKERGIPMSGMNIAPIRADIKTQTRRILHRLLRFGEVTEFGVSDTPGYDWHFRDKKMLWHDISHNQLMEYCPYGQPGDSRLWVREAWRTESDYYNDLSPSELSGEETILYEAAGDWSDNKTVGRHRHARFMPRWASRILLEVTDIRVERLQDISAEDAKAEGISCDTVIIGANCNGGFHSEEHAKRYFFDGCDEEGFEYPEDAYMALWESINGAGSWDANPWVWVIEFKRIES